MENTDNIEEVIDKFSAMVFRLAFARVNNSHDANDILQEVFIKYIRYKDTIKDDYHLKAWLIRTTINCSKTLLNSAWFRKTVALEDNTVYELKQKSEVYYKVMELPQKYRTVVHLYYYEDLSVLEISKILKCKESTIKSQLFRARDMLRKMLRGVDINV